MGLLLEKATQIIFLVHHRQMRNYVGTYVVLVSLFTVGRAVAAYLFTRAGGVAASTRRCYRRMVDVDEKKAAGFFYDK